MAAPAVAGQLAGPAAGGGATAAPEIAGAAAASGAGAPGGGAAGTPAVAGAGGVGPAAAGSGGTGGAPSTDPGAPTFTRVWDEVLFLKGCAGEYCHGSGQGSLKFKTQREAYDALVNVPAAGPACATSGSMRVAPMDPQGSLLLEKLSHTMPSCGDMMPIGAKLEPNCLSTTPSVCTTERELGLVRDWILAGARDD